MPAYYQSGQGYMAQHSQNVLQSFWGLHRCVSSTFTSFSLKYLPLPLTHMSACPQLGVEPQLGCLCPSCSSLGCISAPTNCKVTEVSQHCKNSLIIHIRKSVRAAKPSRIQVHYTLSWTLLGLMKPSWKQFFYPLFTVHYRWPVLYIRVVIE